MVLSPETRIDTAMAAAATIPMTATITFITSAPSCTDFYNSSLSQLARKFASSSATTALQLAGEVRQSSLNRPECPCRPTYYARQRCDVILLPPADDQTKENRKQRYLFPLELSLSSPSIRSHSTLPGTHKDPQ